MSGMSVMKEAFAIALPSRLISFARNCALRSSRSFRVSRSSRVNGALNVGRDFLFRAVM